MRLISSFILAATLATLGGCRVDNASKASSQIDAQPGNSTPQSAAPAPPRPADVQAPAVQPQDNRPLIVCFGDSLTAGFGADQAYPEFLQRDLDAQGFHYRVVNEGVSGNTTKDGIDRLPGIVAMKPAVVIVEFGGNDGLRGFKTQVTHDNLSQIISTLQAAGSKVVIAGISLPPDYGADYVKAFDANYTALAKQYHAPLLPFLLQNVYGVPGMMQADRTHATNKGNEIVARNLLPVLTPVLKK